MQNQTKSELCKELILYIPSISCSFQMCKLACLATMQMYQVFNLGRISNLLTVVEYIYVLTVKSLLPSNFTTQLDRKKSRRNLNESSIYNLLNIAHTFKFTPEFWTIVLHSSDLAWFCILVTSYDRYSVRHQIKFHVYPTIRAPALWFGAVPYQFRC